MVNYGKQKMNRRAFSTMSLMGGMALIHANKAGAADKEIKMFKNLGPGHIRLRVNQKQAVDYAIQYGFGGVNPQLGDLANMSKDQRNELVNYMKDNDIQFGSAGLPVQFRTSEDQFRKDILQLPAKAAVLESVEVTRMSTWILPGHDELTYLANFKIHKERLAEAARILQHHGLRLGLEFVGPKTSRVNKRYPFIYSQIEMQELIEAINVSNVGFLLDAWHWHTSHGTVEEIKQLKNSDIVNVHVNDTPKGIPTDELMDLSRELPTATGVIDLKSFINVLYDIGYDGPITCEPFNKELNAMSNGEKLQETIKHLSRLFDLIEQ